MSLKDVNFNELRVFLRVFEKRSMTGAAFELHLTQSGVSQHIKSLEQSLKLRLFDRVKKTLVPTHEAVELYQSCREGLVGIQATLDRFAGDAQILRGTFRIASPVEFGKNILSSQLSAFLRLHPNVKVRMDLGFSSDFLSTLLSGHLDMAVVDSFATHPALKAEKIYAENLELCLPAGIKIPSGRGKSSELKDFLLQQSYVDYDPKASLVDRWLRHHFNKVQGRPRIVATAGQSQILAQWVNEGLGGAILPHHLVQRLRKEKYVFQTVKGPRPELSNSLYLVSLKQRPSLVEAAFRKFLVDLAKT